MMAGIELSGDCLFVCLFVCLLLARARPLLECMLNCTEFGIPSLINCHIFDNEKGS